MGLGEPTWELPAPARQALAAEAGPADTAPTQACPELREAVARWHGADAEEVLITSGSEAALFSLLLAWLGPGDEVLVPDPGFPAYPVLARMAGAGRGALPPGPRRAVPAGGPGASWPAWRNIPGPRP